MALEVCQEGDVSYLYDKISEGEILDALKLPADYIRDYLKKLPIDDGVERYYALCEKAFVKFVRSLKVVKLPVFKVVVPCGPVGANYYIVRGEIVEGREVIVFFRGTYGYSGAGPHQSAFVEKFFKLFRYPIQTRCGDYLLSLLCIV